MKQLLTLTLIVLCTACGDDETTYSDLSGGWKFQSNIFSGSFNLAKSGTEYTVQSATFVINGKTYTTNQATTFTQNGSSLGNIRLYTSDGFITFSGATFNSDFTEIKAMSYVYAENCLTTNCVHNTATVEVIIGRS